MKLYHVTTPRAAQEIMRAGFKNGRVGSLIGTASYRAVSLLDRPADVNNGARGDGACLEVEVPDEVARRYEFVVELVPEELDTAPPGINAFVAEWPIPAAVLNRFPRRVLSPAEADELGSTPPQMTYRSI